MLALHKLHPQFALHKLAALLAICVLAIAHAPPTVPTSRAAHTCAGVHTARVTGGNCAYLARIQLHHAFALRNLTALLALRVLAAAHAPQTMLTPFATSRCAGVRVARVIGCKCAHLACMQLHEPQGLHGIGPQEICSIYIR